MKLGFWTLLSSECEWDNEEIAQRAASLGYDGVDLRVHRRDGRPSLGSNISLDSGEAKVAGTRAAFAAAGVEIASLLCYNASPVAGSVAAWTEFEREIELHADLADRLGTSRIRIVVEGPPDGLTWAAYLERVWETAGQVLDKHPGMDAVIENHPQRANAGQLLAMAARAGDPRLGVEFSPEHALVMQENILELIDRYAAHIHKVCFADRRVVQDDLARFDGHYYYVRYEPCWNGDGIVPTGEMLARLARGGFADYISLKYERSAIYGLHLPPAQLALEHFPGFIRQFPASSSRERGTGDTEGKQSRDLPFGIAKT